jgi:hypothetical protein
MHLVIKTFAAMDSEKGNQQQPQQSPSQNTDGKRSADYQDEFLNTGRIGRRNALPDILDNHCETSTADLPLKLSALTTNGEFCISFTSNFIFTYVLFPFPHYHFRKCV